ncbi:hypothetical protein LENED_005408 [Lentinula edodes]|uniref:Uncharacterized protein n=1 Tax=Lentinula edodes TaxID=5353 RepID=A0A1Q3E8X4_LENED|nr:hypothetical protein LENED_005408 [Lentinula edodes]
MSSNNLASFAPYRTLGAQRLLPQRDLLKVDHGFHINSPHKVSPTNLGSHNQWETRYGTRVDMLSAFAYILGPLSALAVLIIETQNDYVRFHGYQSALFTTPIIVFRAFLSILQFPQWFRTFVTVLIFVGQLYMAFRAYIDASQNGLSRFQLPIIGPIASQWLADE